MTEEEVQKWAASLSSSLFFYAFLVEVEVQEEGLGWDSDQ